MSSLLSLPPEIFNAVVEELSGNDIINLRRVCRHTHALSIHQFGLKCLADLSFIWSSYSLQGLVDLSRHALGRYVRRLTFATHLVYAGRLTENPTEQRTAKLQSIFEQWEERNELLVRALENFEKLPVQPILGVYDDLVPWVSLDNNNDNDDDSNDRSPRKGYGYEKSYDTVENSQPQFIHTIEYVLKAARQANFAIKAFHIHWHEDRKHDQDELLVLHQQLLFSAPGKSNPGFELMATLEHSKHGEVHLRNSTQRFLIDTRHRKLELYTLEVKGIQPFIHPRTFFP